VTAELGLHVWGFTTFSPKSYFRVWPLVLGNLFFEL
jgi:hypothetical protein